MSHFDVGKAAADSIGHWFQSCLDEGHPDLYRINREQTNKALKIFLLCFLLLALNYPSDVEEDNVQDAKGRSGEPDGEEGDEREGDTPDEGQWQSEQGGQQAVNPVAGTGEKNVRWAPDRIETVRHIRFGKNIFKVELLKKIRKRKIVKRGCAVSFSSSSRKHNFGEKNDSKREKSNLQRAFNEHTEAARLSPNPPPPFSSPSIVSLQKHAMARCSSRTDASTQLN